MDKIKIKLNKSTNISKKTQIDKIIRLSDLIEPLDK